MEPNTNVDLKNLDDAWRILDRLCAKDYKTFINVAPCCDPKILNHVIAFSPSSKFTLFGTAIREKNIELVEYMLTCGLFTEQTLNHSVFNNCNIFSYACLLNEQIGILLLNSDKILPLTINTSLFRNLFSHTTHGGHGGSHMERTDLIDHLFRSEKFLNTCSHLEIICIFCIFMKSVDCPKLIEKSLEHDKLTSDIIENIYVDNIHTNTSISLLEHYCKTNSHVILKMFLDSNKVSTQYVFSLRSKLNISSYTNEIKNVLKSHVKFSNIYDDAQYNLMVQQNSLEAEIASLEKMLADLKSTL